MWHTWKFVCLSSSVLKLKCSYNLEENKHILSFIPSFMKLTSTYYMPGSQLGYLDSKERSLIIMVSGCRIMKTIQNYTHDIFFSKTYSVSSVICVNIHSVASANFDFTFDFSLFLYLCPNKSVTFIYTPSRTH